MQEQIPRANIRAELQRMLAESTAIRKKAERRATLMRDRQIAFYEGVEETYRGLIGWLDRWEPPA